MNTLRDSARNRDAVGGTKEQSGQPIRLCEFIGSTEEAQVMVGNGGSYIVLRTES